jgi:hypothetical protein
MMDLTAVWTVWAWIGWLLSTVILGIGYVVTGYIGSRVFKRITRIYHLRVVAYWLDRLEREGKRTFQRADGASAAGTTPPEGTLP